MALVLLRNHFARRICGVKCAASQLMMIKLHSSPILAFARSHQDTFLQDTPPSIKVVPTRHPHHRAPLQKIARQVRSVRCRSSDLLKKIKDYYLDSSMSYDSMMNILKRHLVKEEEEEKKELTAGQRILALLIMFAVLLLGLSPILCIVCISTSFARFIIQQRQQQQCEITAEQASHIPPPSNADLAKIPIANPII